MLHSCHQSLKYSQKFWLLSFSCLFLPHSPVALTRPSWSFTEAISNISELVSLSLLPPQSIFQTVSSINQCSYLIVLQFCIISFKVFPVSIGQTPLTGTSHLVSPANPTPQTHVFKDIRLDSSQLSELWLYPPLCLWTCPSSNVISTAPIGSTYWHCNMSLFTRLRDPWKQIFPLALWFGHSFSPRVHLLEAWSPDSVRLTDDWTSKIWHLMGGPKERNHRWD